MAILKDIYKLFKSDRRILTEADNTVKVNESIGRAAFYYEKLRNSLEWQDEHLFLKNAIKRILKRRIYLGINQSDTAKILFRELVWAKYFDNETIPLSYVDEVAAILRKFNYLRKSISSGAPSTKITETVLGLAACEIEEFLKPSSAEQKYVDFTTEKILTNLDISSQEIDPKNLKAKVGIAVMRELFKADLNQLQYYLIKKTFSAWPNVSKKQIEYFGKNYDSIIGFINSEIFDKENIKIQKYVKKKIPPFRIIWEIINQSADDRDNKILESEIDLENAAYEIIRRKNKNIYSRIFRSLLRGIIFILLTKIILALVVEYPYEINVYGEANYIALLINILLPPILMLIIGLFIKVPGQKNTKVLIDQVSKIVLENKYSQGQILTLRKSRSRSFVLFNFIYIISSIAILALVVRGLLALNFNIVSIILFFFFVSLVSFLGFRISSIAKELEVRSRDDTLLAGAFNFIFLPFVYIGKVLSEQWSNYNITLWFWDFIIEAPFKTIISLFESWLSFVREKREDFE